MSATVTHIRIADTAAGRPVPRPIATVICAGCEAMEFTRPDHMPSDWRVEDVADSLYAFCPGCAIDLPASETAQ